MEVVIEKLPKSSVKVKLTLSPDSYEKEFKKQINSYARQAVLPGFRLGTVPPDLIKAKYGQSILYDVINKKVSDELQKIIDENKYELIARPLLKSSDLKNLKPNEEFNFEFQLALFPDFEIDFSKLPLLHDFNIEITEEELEKQIKFIQRKDGKLTAVTEINELDKLFKIHGVLMEIDEKDSMVENGLQIEIDVYSDAEKFSKHLKNGLKIGDKIIIPLSDFFEDIQDAIHVLKLSKEKISEIYDKKFLFEVKGIWSVTELDREKELFQKIFKNTNITYQEGLDDYKKILQKDLEKLQENYKKEFIEKELLKNCDFEIDEEIIAYSVMTDYQFKTIDELHKRFPNYLDVAKLEIIKQKIFKENPELGVTVKDVAKKIEEDLSLLFTKTHNNSDVSENNKSNPDSTVSENSSEIENTNSEVEEFNPSSELEDQATQQYIQSVTKRIMQDKKFVNKKMVEMEDENLIRFYENKVGKKSENVTVKKFLETIQIH